MNSVIKKTKKKFAFIRRAAYPIPNQMLPGLLSQVFPEYDIDIIDIKSLVKKRPVIFIMNLFLTFFEYSAKIASRDIKLREAFFLTSYINKIIGALVKERIECGEYAFTFQIQSLFDAGTRALPHFVYTDHTHLARLTYPDFDRRKLHSKKWLKMERGLYQNAAVNFTRSSNISKSLREQYDVPDSKIVLAGVGSNVPIDNTILNNDNYQNKNILFVGIDWERKGGPDLLRAFQKVLEKHPDATLTIVGASPEIKLANCSAVGKIPIEEMRHHFKKASVFCLPTKMEPFGVAFIEALYYKLPIVATNVGAIPDFVESGKNGYLVEPGDVEGLARNLDILLGDPKKCEAFGQRGFALAQANYSWDRVAQKMSGVIREIISPSP